MLLNSNKVALQQCLTNIIHAFFKEGFVKGNMYATVLCFHVHFKIKTKRINRKEKRILSIDKHNKLLI